MSYLEDIPPELWIYGSIVDYLDPIDIGNIIIGIPYLGYLEERLRTVEAIESLIQNRVIHKFCWLLDKITINHLDSRLVDVLNYRTFFDRLFNTGQYKEYKSFILEGTSLENVKVLEATNVEPFRVAKFCKFKTPRSGSGFSFARIDIKYTYSNNPYDVRDEEFVKEFDEKESQRIREASARKYEEKMRAFENHVIEERTYDSLVKERGENIYENINYDNSADYSLNNMNDNNSLIFGLSGDPFGSSIGYSSANFL